MSTTNKLGLSELAEKLKQAYFGHHANLEEQWLAVARAAMIYKPMLLEITGRFKFIEKNAGWGDSFTVVDDDSMPFVLDDLKSFHDKGVRVTIELDEPTQKQLDAWEKEKIDKQ